MPKYLPPEEFKSIYSRVPRLCIDLIVDSDDGVLLTKREIDPGKGFWHLPGGTVLLGEPLEDAARRILENETGLTARGFELIGTLEFPDEGNPFRHAVSLVFQVIGKRGKMRGSDQAREMAFFNELPELMISEHREFLEEE
ncbi:NUDIX domain-containing protein [Puniceicoccaceae bacterium K14]|nr:NUDIX domain-containing protein [Puniceicoccaceae bacterium K14]